MKKPQIKCLHVVLTIFALVSIVFSFEACRKIKDNFKLIIDPQLTTAQFSIQFVDAVTQQPIGMNGGPPVMVKIVGKNADKVYEVSGMQKATYSASKGVITFGVDPNALASSGHVLRFTIVADADGYISNSHPVLVSGNIRQLIKLTMVSKTNLPNGVVMIRDESLTANNGSIGTSSTISTPYLQEEYVQASITIDSHTILKDVTGQRLHGQLSTEIIFFSCINDNALSAFPGGLIAYDIERESTVFSSLFASAGFISIKITDETGKRAVYAEGKPISLEMGIPDETFNPFTQSKVRTGDTIPFWRMDNDQGNWIYMSTNAVTASSDLTYKVDIDHLSSFNIDWPERNLDPETLDENSTVTMWGIQNNKSSTGLQNGDQLFLNYRLRKQTDQTIITESFLIATIGSTDTLINSVCGYPLVFELFTNTQSISYETDEFCGFHEIDLSAFNILSGVGNVVINIIGQCADNPEIEVRPSLSYHYKNLSEVNSQWMMGFTEEGTTTISQVKFGDTYLFGIYINEEWHEYTFIFAEEQYDFYIDVPESYCLN